MANLDDGFPAPDCSHLTFLVFEEGQTVLKEELFKGFSPMDREITAYHIYYQLMEGLFCLHYDINRFYNHLLKKYFEKQDKREDNQLKAEINKIHRCGIYHRDIKPFNIILDFQTPLQKHPQSLRIRIIDFGMAGIANF